jgi:hypothetical protein
MSDIHIHIDRETPVKVITLEPNGARGAAATVSVGATTTGAAGTNASVTNSGTTSAAVFNFTIPRGATGAAGPNSVTSATSSDGTADLSVNTLESENGISVTGLAQRIFTTGTSGHIETTAVNAYIQTRDAFRLFDGTNTTILSHAPTEEIRQIAFPDADGTVALGSGTNGAIISADITDATSDGYTNPGKLLKTDASTGSVSVAALGITNAIGSATFSISSLTDDRTFTFPDVSGTFALTSQTVLKSDYTPAHSLLVQQSGTGSPSVVTVGTNTILGRATGGGSDIAALTPSQARTVMELTALATTTPAANVATFLATPTSANLAAAVTDETGTGSLVFATSPTFTTNLRVNSTGIGTTITLARSSNDDKVAIGYNPAGAFSVSNPQWSSGINNGSSNYSYSTWNGSVLTERLTLATNGSVGINNSSPNAKALLDLTSTTMGFLPPRMTTAQRDAITSVPAGLMIYNTSTNKLNFYNGSAWEAVVSL